MPSVNCCHFMGHLGSDPAMSYTTSGKAFCKISLAVQERQFGDREPKTLWLRVVFWNKLAETVNEYLLKGSLIFVAGRLTCNEWKDKDGVQRKEMELVANEMVMLGGKGAKPSGEQRQESSPPMAEGNIPF